MKKVGVAVLGLGVVGGGTCKILIDRKSQIAKEYGVDIDITPYWIECRIELPDLGLICPYLLRILTIYALIQA